jgi:ferrous iron transport protein B
MVFLGYHNLPKHIFGRAYQFSTFRRNNSGIGGIVIFAPQIGILLYFLYLLEDSGYMARVIFLMDRFLRPFGLNGKSIVPLVSGTACAIPAIMSTRNIENVKRLNYYFNHAFYDLFCKTSGVQHHYCTYFSNETIWGIQYKALALFAMYFLGFVMALISAFILKYFIKNKGKRF